MAWMRRLVSHLPHPRLLTLGGDAASGAAGLGLGVVVLVRGWWEACRGASQVRNFRSQDEEKEGRGEKKAWGHDDEQTS